MYIISFAFLETTILCCKNHIDKIQFKKYVLCTTYVYTCIHVMGKVGNKLTHLVVILFI